MTTIDSVHQHSALSAATRANQATAKETEDRFLTLLVTQLQNQDPLNPMDNAQITSQMSQMATVNGINALNATLDSITGQMDLSQAMQASNLIGKGVLIPGSKISLGTSSDGQKVATTFGVDLMRNADSVTITILDSSGKAVKTIEERHQQTGILSFEWDGISDEGVEMADGAYSVRVQAKDANGAEVPVEALTYGQVQSIAYTTQGMKMDLGLAGHVALTDLRKVMN